MFWNEDFEEYDKVEKEDLDYDNDDIQEVDDIDDSEEDLEDFSRKSFRLMNINLLIKSIDTFDNNYEKSFISEKNPLNNKIEYFLFR